MTAGSYIDRETTWHCFYPISPFLGEIISIQSLGSMFQFLGMSTTTTATTTSLIQIKYGLQSLSPQLRKAIRSGYKRKKKVL